MKLSGRARRIIPLIALLLICLCLLSVVTRQVVRAGLEMTNARRVQAGEAVGVRPWMTIPYIARTYGVPAETLYAAIGVPATAQNNHAPLQVLARSAGHDLDGDIAKLNGVIDRSQPLRRPSWPPMPFGPASPTTPRTAP